MFSPKQGFDLQGSTSRRPNGVVDVYAEMMKQREAFVGDKFRGTGEKPPLRINMKALGFSVRR
ncbi:hypothetical protein PtA15_9A53 [Puccinia triticina]|uniref:Uncharacterized protein n=1 Tax=Puccinia triticina TaxID=208348 RepID=A0ABY7CRN1_9BASI|nr:uncharacterized protein PtA15_9A53 [Puccinia triticina]WAQ87929.1 hypothetical protein PtA15_9A53 [Puccinia triticina]